MRATLEQISRTFSDQSNLIAEELDLTGEINGHELEGDFKAVYSITENRLDGVFEVTDVPDLGNYFFAVSKMSIACLWCSAFSRPLAGCVNISTIAGNRLDGSVTYNLSDDKGNGVGRIHQEGKGLFEDPCDPGFVRHIKIKERLTGEYDGPRDVDPRWILKYSRGYAVALRQVGPGRLEGSYAYPVYGPSLDDPRATLYANAVRRYSYDGDGTIPFDEVQLYGLRDLSVVVEGGRRIVRWSSSGCYVPAHDLALGREDDVGQQIAFKEL